MQASLKGLRRGNWVDLHGPSGSGKTVVMLDIARYSLSMNTQHILFIDFDDRVKPIANDRFHLFQLRNPSNLSARLQCWLEEHVELDVLWIMIDNTGSVGTKCWHEMKKLKDKWGFVLLTSTPISCKLQENDLHRFEISVSHNVQLQLVWPALQDRFSVTISL